VKLLVLSMDTVGEGLALAVRACKAGHQVRLWTAPECNPTCGAGFKGLDRVKEWLPSARWADLVVPTGNHLYMPKLDALRKVGVRIFGPSVASANLEIQREQGMRLFEQHQIEIPKYKTFATLEQAEAHVRKTGQRYVFKTLGDEDDKSLSYVAKTPADMVARLRRWQKLGMRPKGKVMLQEVVDGVEIGVSCWMGAEGFIGQPNENFEFKKLLSGNAGPNCGEAGTVMKYCKSSGLADDVLYPLEEALVKLGHLGDIDVNCIVDKKGQAWPLEFTCRLGWPAANIMWASHKEDPVEWMLEACEGHDTLQVSPQIACGIVLAQPDYPYSNMTKAETDGIPIYGVTSANQKYIAPQSVKIVPQPVMDGEAIVDKPTWTTTGDYIAVATALGKSVRQACDRAYETIKQLHVPNLIYRDDIGEKLEDELKTLHPLGYAVEFDYG